MHALRTGVAMENNILRTIACKILAAAVRDSLHSTRMSTRAELLAFIADTSWFSALCAIAGVEDEDRLRRRIYENVMYRAKPAQAC